MVVNKRFGFLDTGFLFIVRQECPPPPPFRVCVYVGAFVCVLMLTYLHMLDPGPSGTEQTKENEKEMVGEEE